MKEEFSDHQCPLSWEIDFEPIGLRGPCPSGVSLLECARLLGVDLINLCGGFGNCGRCIIRIIEGNATPPTETEKKCLPADQLKRGFRLACQTIPLSGLKVAVPPDSLTAPQRTQVESIALSVVPEPLIHLYPVMLPPTDLENPASLYRRMMNRLYEKYGLKDLFVDLETLRKPPSFVKDKEGEVKVAVREKEIIGRVDGNRRPLGLAVDLGTTKIAAYLVDLDTGQNLGSRGMMNPQIQYGEDIIARFLFAQASPDQAGRLQKILMDTLNRMLMDLCDDAGVSADDILEAVVVGNTAMHHLFLGIPTDSLSRAPYTPAIDIQMDVKARDLGLKTAPGAYIHFLPNIAGFVGSDHVAMLLAVEILHKNGVVLALDIGTNTEICLADKGRLFSLSCASGPAFEGAHVTYGMRAGDGAIEGLKIDNHNVRYQTIGGKPAKGFCGSGILDVTAELYKVGAIEKNGRMKGDHPLIRTINDRKEFVIALENHDRTRNTEIAFTQKDVREIQLAKGAIKTGIQVLLSANHLTEKDIDQIIIAGAFGSYIDVESAKTVAMLPDISANRIVQVGNAAGLGSRLALISKTKRQEAVQIARTVNYIELAAFPDFSTIFTDAMYLGQGK